MVKMQVSLAETWQAIEEAAVTAKTCVSPNRNNWDKAHQTWERYQESKDCQYWLIHPSGTNRPSVGYLRLLKVSPGTTLRPTYLVDYVNPSQYLVPYLVAKALPDATVIVKVFGVDDDYLAEKWPRITLSLPALERYSYSNTMVGVSEFKVILT